MSSSGDSLPTAPDRTSATIPVAPAAGDLGLSTPMTRPVCDGSGIVVLYNATAPGSYESEIASALATYPGSSYLRTDQACSSLRQQSEAGNPIYTIFRYGGSTVEELCSSVRGEGGGAYGKWLDNTTDPATLISC